MPIYNAQILQIDPVETRRYAGLRKAKNFNEENIIDACEDARLLIDVRGIWNIYDYDCKNHVVCAEPKFKIIGNSINKHLNGCDKVICLAATIGEAIEQEITNRFKNGQYVSSMLLDAAATCAVEQAADAMEKAIAQKVNREGYTMKWRFSPGYGDWDLTQQAELFRISCAGEIGIKLTDAMMMIPRKSITAIIGLIKNEFANKNSCTIKSHDCSRCNKLDCAMRNI